MNPSQPPLLPSDYYRSEAFAEDLDDSPAEPMVYRPRLNALLPLGALGVLVAGAAIVLMVI